MKCSLATKLKARGICLLWVTYWLVQKKSIYIYINNDFQMKRKKNKKKLNINTCYIEIIRKQYNCVLFPSMKAIIEAVSSKKFLMTVVTAYLRISCRFLKGRSRIYFSCSYFLRQDTNEMKRVSEQEGCFYLLFLQVIMLM